MSEDMLHPTPDRFEAYLDRSLPDAERAVLDSHVQACTRCHSELEEWRTLFAVLADLPRLQPTAGFAERIMARVQVRQPWFARVAAWAGRLLPHSTSGWVALVGLLAIPPAVIGAGTWWLFSQPWVTPEGLLIFAQQRATDALLALVGQAGSTVLETGAASWLITQARAAAASLDPGEIGAIAALFGTLTVVSGWVLYSNLIRTRTRESGHVSYSF